MSKSDNRAYKNAWLDKLRQDHPALAERMIRDAYNRGEVSLKDQILSALLEPIEPIPTSRDEWCEIKASKIAKIMEGL